MRFSWQKISRSLLTYSRSDRNGVVIIGALILLVVIANAFVQNLEPQSSSDFSEIKLLFEQWENAEVAKQENERPIFFRFDPNTISEKGLDSLSLPNFIKKNMLSYRKAGGVYKCSADFRKTYGMNDSLFALVEEYIVVKTIEAVKFQPTINSRVVPKGCFDPNSAGITELKRFGFNTYQSNNLVNYRKKGGVFRISSDLLKIYGVDSIFYSSIYESIKIEKLETKANVESDKIILIELNEADSADLVQLEGVGAIYAKRIIKYRNLLGGFYSKEQLKEVYNFPEETYMHIENYIYADTMAITQLRLNFSEFQELLRHPYMSKKQVEALLYRREKQGAFKNLSELNFVEGFDSESIKKIAPYFTCR